MKKTMNWRSSRPMIGVAVAAVFASSALADDKNRPCSEAVELWSVFVNYAQPGDAQKTRTAVTFRLRSRDDRWVFSRVKDARSKEAKPTAYSTYISHNWNDGDWWAHYNSNSLPADNRIVLDESLVVTRLKKGRAFSSDAFELGASGAFEAEGIPFSYRSYMKPYDIDEHARCELTLTYPKEVSLAMAEVLDGQGLRVAISTEECRINDRAETKIKWLLHNGLRLIGRGKIRERFSVRATLREAEETIQIPVNMILAMGGEPGSCEERQESDDENDSDVTPVCQENEAAPLPVCPVDVALQEYRGTREWTLECNLAPKDHGVSLTMGSDKTIVAHDAASNELKGTYKGDIRSANEDGSLNISLHFDRMPQGGWIDLDTNLRLLAVKGKRTLPPLELPADKEGTIEIEGLRFDYGASAFHSNEPEDKKLTRQFLYPNDGRIASVKLQHADGTEVPCCGDGLGNDGSRFFFSTLYKISPSSQPVRAIITLYDGEPCLVPLKMRVGLSGRMDAEEQPASVSKEAK